MNHHLDLLQPYPFERLRQLFDGLTPPAHLAPINLSIGEPKHATPAVIRDALTANLGGLANYPTTAGTPALREAIAAWLARRYRLPAIDPGSQVLPVNGTREALFAIAQTVVDRRRADGRAPLVVAPNPFYQIYEGAALLAGARLRFLRTLADDGFRMHWESISPAEWADVQLVYVCSPGNPTGRVMPASEWRLLFELADRHNFVIASDECYSEIYTDEAAPPLGALQAAWSAGRTDFARLVVFGSLSKRSNAPGLRSGFVAGDARVLKQFLLYRTYHGNAMSPPVQAASIAAWNDEAHVVDNRRRYRTKFETATPLIAPVLPTARPEAAFYLWARTPADDAAYARRLYAEQNVTVLPGSYLSREADGQNPGRGYVRIALVADEAEVAEAARRIALADITAAHNGTTLRNNDVRHR